MCTYYACIMHNYNFDTYFDKNNEMFALWIQLLKSTELFAIKNGVEIGEDETKQVKFALKVE